MQYIVKCFFIEMYRNAMNNKTLMNIKCMTHECLQCCYERPKDLQITMRLSEAFINGVA